MLDLFIYLVFLLSGNTPEPATEVAPMIIDGG
jgi:hypothetical protein